MSAFKSIQSQAERSPRLGSLDPAPLHRLATLLWLAEGAWALAVYDDPAHRRRLLHELRAAVAPLPVIEVSLAQGTPDPLSVLHTFVQHRAERAPLVSFTGVERALPDLAGYLELERDTLARLPQRLLFWVTPDDVHDLALQAPNFLSRISGIFDFAGRGTGLLDRALEDRVPADALIH